VETVDLSFCVNPNSTDHFWVGENAETTYRTFLLKLRPIELLALHSAFLK
jgi:hypothetical protein